MNCRYIGILFGAVLAYGQSGALRLTEPAPPRDGTIVTSQPAIHLHGTLAWQGGDMRVEWVSNRGFSDLAAVSLDNDRHTVRWSTSAPIPLLPGVNHVRIRALGQPGAATFVNIYYNAPNPASEPPVGTAMLLGQPITYEAIDGQAVYQSDMVLGAAADVAAGRMAGRFAAGGQRPRPQGVTIGPNYASPTGLWPIVNGVVRVPYTMTTVNAANINAAIAESNSQLAGVVQWISATASDVDLVNFNFTAGQQNGSCESIVGMQGGTQTIGGAANCTTVTVLHEMGHALGLYHEQSRADRNTYIDYQEANVDKPLHSNFDIIQGAVVSGLFNYASIMEYGAFIDSRYGVSPVIETIPAGIVLSTDLPQYTTGDLDAIERLYGFTPTALTVDTNPSGLQVVVDNVACTAPCVFTNWTAGSQHTLAAPLDAHSQTLQILNQQPYIFGNWNTSSTSPTITVTNSPGNGTLLSPTTAPAVTNYLASFIPVHPYKPTVFPANSGTISVSPTPGTLIINGTSTSYFPDRQYVAMTVNASSGYTFYDWANVAIPGLYSYFLKLYIDTNFDYLNFDTSDPVTAVMVSGPTLTVTAESEDIVFGIFPGFSFGVVGPNNFTLSAYAPRNFSAAYDGVNFAAGSQVTLCASGLSGTTCPTVAPAQSPVTTNVSYAFEIWNGSAGASTNAISASVPTSGQSDYVMNFTPSYRVIVQPSISPAYCPGVSVTASPAGTNSNGTEGTLDEFFTGGTTTFTAITDTGVVNFVGWTQDLTGSSNPYPFNLTSQLIATANYNVPGTTQPLAITSVSPATPTVTGGSSNLVVTGTGFTTNNSVTYAYFGVPGSELNYRPVTLQSATQLTIQLQPGDLAAAGSYQIAVLNATPQNCNPQTFYTFAVANSAGAPALTISKSHTGNFSVGELNATYAIAVSNTGTAATSGPVTVTDAVPSGETLVLMKGTGWNCTLSSASCARSDSLGAGLSYGAITVTIDVATNASSPQVNAASIQGGGAESSTVTDSTVISTLVTVPNVAAETQSAATTALQNLDLVVGTVTTQSSNTVPSGSVISASPSPGNTVSPGTTVSLVVSSGPSLGACDVASAGAYTIVDAQKILNEALGNQMPVNDLNGDGVVNVVDIMDVLNAVLHGVCTTH